MTTTSSAHRATISTEAHTSVGETCHSAFMRAFCGAVYRRLAILRPSLHTDNYLAKIARGERDLPVRAFWSALANIKRAYGVAYVVALLNTAFHYLGLRVVEAGERILKAFPAECAEATTAVARVQVMAAELHGKNPTPEQRQEFAALIAEAQIQLGDMAEAL